VKRTVKTVERVVEIINPQGLHARPVMMFVDLASKYSASITVHKDGEKVDGKSPMEMMLLEAPKGTRLHLTATGPDADDMVDALARLVSEGFGEK
jgi:phosphocarrier protein